MIQSEDARDPSWFEGPSGNVACRALITVFSVILMLVEFMQMQFYGKYYFFDIWNYLQLTTYVLNFTVVYLHSSASAYDVLDLSRAASIGSFGMWLIVFSWMRLFHQTSFYVMMIIQAVYDIRYFLVMILLCVCMFGNAILILDDTQDTMSLDVNESYEMIVPKQTWYRFVDAMIYQYMVGIGEISTDNYDDNKDLGFLWFYMILATIITQLIFLNILIAIISDTYKRITEHSSTYALMQRTEKHADMIMMIRLSEKLTKSRYLYVVTPIDVTKEEDKSAAIHAFRLT
jgi:hypothetical protein